jgi:hypothetical protein
LPDEFADIGFADAWFWQRKASAAHFVELHGVRMDDVQHPSCSDLFAAQVIESCLDYDSI